jgi:hypothetical protein
MGTNDCPKMKKTIGYLERCEKDIKVPTNNMKCINYYFFPSLVPLLV